MQTPGSWFMISILTTIIHAIIFAISDEYHSTWRGLGFLPGKIDDLRACYTMDRCQQLLCVLFHHAWTPSVNFQPEIA